MPFIEYQKRLHRLKEGENVVGADEGASLRLPELEGAARLVISVEPFGTFAWALQERAPIAINGRALQREPVPLFHGDRLTLNGAPLVYIDDGGEATVKLDARVPAAVARAAGLDAVNVEPDLMRRVTPAEGERRVVAVLRRHDNNQCYVIDRAGFRIGRERQCDLIIPDRNISRLHAEITFVRGQYLLRDLGRASTRVNGRKIGEPHKLQVGDTIQVGKYEFTFLRRPATAEDIVPAKELTPIRSAVPDAPTLELRRTGGSRLITWLLIVVVAATAALMFLT